MSEKVQKYISIKGAKENNLKNISLEIPRNKITAVVGVSGSGKSSLIIDILQKESIRQLFDMMGIFLWKKTLTIPPAIMVIQTVCW